ncbi:MAG: toxin-antitoxin system HicB family antitoxin [Caulobacteraceae bacterium]
MNLDDLIDTLRQDLARAADVGGAEGRAAAERLLLALDPAMRLVLMDALSRAAAEIGQAAPGLSVRVVLRGRELAFEAEGAPSAHAEASPEMEDGEATARITLRLPETLKARAEAVAASRGQSLNTWLVMAARAAAGETGRHDYWSSSRHGPGQRVKGWAR